MSTTAVNRLRLLAGHIFCYNFLSCDTAETGVVFNFRSLNEALDHEISDWECSTHAATALPARRALEKSGKLMRKRLSLMRVQADEYQSSSHCSPMAKPREKPPINPHRVLHCGGQREADDFRMRGNNYRYHDYGTQHPIPQDKGISAYAMLEIHKLKGSRSRHSLDSRNALSFGITSHSLSYPAEKSVAKIGRGKLGQRSPYLRMTQRSDASVSRDEHSLDHCRLNATSILFPEFTEQSVIRSEQRPRRRENSLLSMPRSNRTCLSALRLRHSSKLRGLIVPKDTAYLLGVVRARRKQSAKLKRLPDMPHRHSRTSHLANLERIEKESICFSV
ncbi:hypothetical protein SISNIDRAFT_471836 [Sistotremastrum niveocremeum HHB9708]|uniref:Uncharacterized protein n=1 Tax=Sistotremastrum niveocremeum HHB9708 TaxID=1314777 RepID=A0A164M5J7_9AGAM|nr:hypothetical protein SISNIDRAFT_471836 [Sistotremastrum niveocremeum HHB9708]